MEKAILWDRCRYCGEIAVGDMKIFSQWKPKLISVLPARVSTSFHQPFLGQLRLSWCRMPNQQTTLAFTVGFVLCWLTVLNTGPSRHWSQHKEESGTHSQGQQGEVGLEQPVIRLACKPLKLKPVLHLETVRNYTVCPACAVCHCTD